MKYQFGNDRYYTVPIPDGGSMQLPSVTTILQVVAKPALVPWARDAALTAVRAILERDRIPYADPVFHAGWVDDIIEEARATPDRIRDDASAFGTAVHEYIRAMLVVGSVANTSSAGALVSEEIVDIGMRFLRWFSKEKPILKASEKIVYCTRCLYAGTLDIVAQGNTGDKTLIDIKTGNALYPEMALQVAAYAHAYENIMGSDPEHHWPGKVIQSVQLVRLPRDKQEPIEVWQESNWWPLFEDFMAIQRLWRRLQRAPEFRANIQR